MSEKPGFKEEEIIEEFDEKLKLHSQDEEHNEKTSIVGQTEEEMNHIFNQFNGDSVNTTETILPSLQSNELKPEQNTQTQQEIPFDFNRFVEQMKKPSSKPITRYFKSFLQAFDRRPWTVNEQIKIIQDFLDFIYIKMRESDVWKDMSEQEFNNAKEGIEKLVMNRLYHLTFSPTTTDDKERDEILYQKISIFRWIREKHLDIPETENNENFLKFAASEILKINSYKAPRDKLICILNCCKVIFGLIKHVEGDAGADKFLPILIYVVIRSNPKQLVSNVQYIYRFRNPEQLQSEAGYYLTNLMGAISFIENMEATSLSITKEEFDQNIEKTMLELKEERSTISIEEKQQISYENTFHPSRSMTLSRKSSQESQSNLIDSAKAAALLEKGSQFAQKTMQKPLYFVGKIFQGLSESSSRAESPTEEHHHLLPPLPPRPQDQWINQQKVQFEANLILLKNMFPNVDDNVSFLVLNANHGDLTKSIDNLLEMSGDNMTHQDGLTTTTLH